AMALPHGCDGLSTRRMAMLWQFRQPSRCRHVRRELMRNAWLDCTPIIPATACHQRNDVETYSRYKVIGINTVSIGSLTASVVHPRECSKPAILSNAAALICCHNHPSGVPQPSQEDRALTKRLVDAGKILGINVLDHIIVGDGSATYFSFAD